MGRRKNRPGLEIAEERRGEERRGEEKRALKLLMEGEINMIDTITLCHADTLQIATLCFCRFCIPIKINLFICVYTFFIIC